MKNGGEIVRDQLAEGNKGARGYFEKRVDMMLRSERDAGRLFEFLRVFWPQYKAGGHYRGLKDRPTDTGSVT